MYVLSISSVSEVLMVHPQTYITILYIFDLYKKKNEKESKKNTKKTNQSAIQILKKEKYKW